MISPTPRLDDAQEQFEESLNQWSAEIYLQVAEEYFADNMIGENEIEFVRQKVKPYLQREMEVAKTVMKRDRNLLRELAKK